MSGNGFTVCKGSGFCPAETKSCHKHIKTMRMRGNTVGDNFSQGKIVVLDIMCMCILLKLMRKGILIFGRKDFLMNGIKR